MPKLHSKNISKDDKIKALERILKAVVGRPEAKIKYRKHFYGDFEIWIECDIDDMLRVMPALQMQEIDVMFYVEGYLDKDPLLYGTKKAIPQGRVIAELQLNPLYWKQVEELKEEIKKIKDKIKAEKKEVE